MSKCIIHFLRAKNGDCFLIELSNKQCILIDCGYKETYQTELKPLLHRLSNKGYRIALFVVTHTDQDHIRGAIAFLEDNKDSASPQVIPIDNIWYNGVFNICSHYTDLLSHIVDELDKNQQEKYRQLTGQLQKLITGASGKISADLAEDFESLCINNHYYMNNGNGLLLSGSIVTYGNCTIKAISPETDELLCFGERVTKELIGVLGKNYSVKKEKLLAFLENMVMVTCKDENGAAISQNISAGQIDIEEWIGTSSKAPMNEANRASIVLDIECCGKRMLFTGDSESEDWIGKANHYYDLVKISHHGTTKPNLKLLKVIDFGKALISTNGSKNNHPEDELLARLINKHVKQIYFNYDISRKEELLAIQQKYGFEAYFGQEQIYIVNDEDEEE